MNWNDPTQRAALIERVGAAEYNRLMAQHFKDSTVAIVNGYRIRPVGSRFGRLFAVHGTPSAFYTQEQAEKHAASLPPYEEKA